MLGSFEELEQDIEKFKNNVMASSELIESLNDVTDVIIKQTTTLDQQTEAVNQVNISVPEKVEKISTESTEKIVAKNNEIQGILEKLPIEVKESLKQYKIAVAEANEAYLKECSDVLERKQQEYISQLEKTKTELEDCKVQIDSAYKGFLQKIQKTDLYGIKKSVIDMKQDVSKKINILIGITAIAVIVAIIGIFI